jgi:predicted RNA-binding Zn ribbon-like protein
VELSSYGELAIRLVNTSGAGPADRDTLSDLDGLRRFLGEENATWMTRATEEDLLRLRALRARLRPVFEDAAAGDDRAAVAQLNALLAEAVIRPQITDHDGEDWHLHIFDGARDPWEGYTAAAVMGLAVLLTEAGVDRLGVCRGAPCRNVFVDTSTNKSRRYCSDRCATRANVAAYRARRRAAG